MDFSNEDLRKLISDKFKGYEVVPCYSSDIVWKHESTREIELHHCVEATDYIVAYYDIDLKKFRGRLFSEDFETELEAVKDFHDHVLKLVAEKEGRKLLKKPIKKYRIRVLKGKPTVSDRSYLNVNYRLNLVSFENGEDFEEWRASFTKKEIEELKKRDDIAIDWDKVELEKVHNAE